MLFCPYCANNLTIGNSEGDERKCWVCPTCPYKWVITKQISMRTHYKRKEVDDVLGGEDAWKNVQQMEARCAKCDFRKAYFREMQIRSADEPSTHFFKCVKCAFQWREG